MKYNEAKQKIREITEEKEQLKDYWKPLDKRFFFWYNINIEGEMKTSRRNQRNHKM